MSLTVAATVGLGSLFGGSAIKIKAASISSLKKEQNQINSERTDLNSNISEADKKIDDLQGQQVDVQAEMKRIDLAIGSTNAKIRDKSAKIDETKAQIAKLQEDIKVIQERIQKRNELLKERARNYQENGGMVSYVDVLMGSQSFSDFVDRANAVATIMEADQDILKQAQADKQELENKQKQVQNDLASLQKMVSDLKVLNDSLISQKAEKDKLLANLKEQEKEAEEYKMDMQEQAQILATQEAAIQKAIKMEQDRQAELARQAAEAAKAAKPGSSGGGATPLPPVSGGNFTRPASGVISSTYGARWGAFHYGVDIANSGGNVPILAAADGVVSQAYSSASYGNVVFISHYINGQLYTTVYAHMKYYMVGSGAVVKKGQQIGVMGSTGESTGQHLHFELYRGPWAYHSAINPMGTVPF